MALCRAYNLHAIGWRGRPRGLRGGEWRVPCDPVARRRVDDVLSPDSFSHNSSHINDLRLYHAIQWTLDAPELSTVIVLLALPASAQRDRFTVAADIFHRPWCTHRSRLPSEASRLRDPGLRVPHSHTDGGPGASGICARLPGSGGH